MSNARLATIAMLPLLAGGCLIPPAIEDPVYSTCHAIASADWTARVDYIPDHHNRPILKPTLIVRGRITVPSEGYAVSLDLGPVQKLDLPVQQILVRTQPPRDPEAPARTEVEVSGAFAAIKHYGAVTIRCGDGTLAIIKAVPRAAKPDARRPRRGRGG